MRRSCLMAGVLAAALVWPFPAAFGDDAAVSTPPAVEAWYRTSPVCATPLGCQQTPSPYPAGTFHVGVTLGSEDSRSYLQLDLSRLPSGARATGGRLVLPLAPQQDGTTNADQARLRACLAPDPVQKTDGTTTSSPPAADCAAAAVAATYVAPTGSTPAGFVVDLTALLTTWTSSRAPGALALVPGDGVQPSDSWHLSFDEQSRTGQGLPKPTATVTYTSAPPAGEPAPSSVNNDGATALPPSTSGLGTSALDGGSLPALPTAGAPSLAAPPAAAPAPAVAGAQQPVAQPRLAQSRLAPSAFVPGGFRYPAVFLLPLLFALAAAWVARALTRDLPGS